MPISFDRAFSVHEDALLLRGRRSSVLAANIANVDTPNYKARDFDFKQILKSASGRQTDRLTLASTNQTHFGKQDPSTAAELQYRIPLHPSLDGNTVDGHVEQAKFSENAILYQTSFTFLNGKVNGLIKALKGE